MKLAKCFRLVVLTCATSALAARANDSQAGASRQIGLWQSDCNEYIAQAIETGTHGCKPENIVRRQEWGSLSKESRLEYISAVKCLQEKPPQISPEDAPGARSRFDDFVATHIIQAPFIHWDGFFLAFHRYYIHLYEKALQDECGYTGTQPYWDWTLSWEDPRKSTVFDGSPYSMGSNGESVSHDPVNVLALGLNITFAPATGGGCVYSGPFTDYTMNMGPSAIQPPGEMGGLAYNPRCLVRDLSLESSSLNKPTDVVNLFRACTDLACFRALLEDINGLHPSGHFSVGGIQLDPFASPGDPAFWLHHTQVDRIWTIWQNLDPDNRTYQISDTQTAFDNPPSDPVTLDTEVEFGVLAPKMKMRDLVSTIDGPFCYEYV